MNFRLSMIFVMFYLFMFMECYNYNSKFILYCYNLLYEFGYNKYNFFK